MLPTVQNNYRDNAYMVLEITSINDLPFAAKQLLEFAALQKIFLFYGDMGAGKTTLVKAMCNELNVTGNVSSPTFSIVNEYDTAEGPVYHFDFYRLKKQTEALDLGYEDYFYSGNKCFVEWPEKIEGLLPEHYVKVEITVAGTAQRIIKAQHI